MGLGSRSLILAASSLSALHAEIVFVQRGTASLRHKQHCASYTQSFFGKSVCVNIGSVRIDNISELVDNLIQVKVHSETLSQTSNLECETDCRRGVGGRWV